MSLSSRSDPGLRGVGMTSQRARDRMVDGLATKGGIRDRRVLDVLRTQVRLAGASCLLVTHSAAAAQRADRVLRLTPHGVVGA